MHYFNKKNEFEWGQFFFFFKAKSLILTRRHIKYLKHFGIWEAMAPLSLKRAPSFFRETWVR